MKADWKADPRRGAPPCTLEPTLVVWTVNRKQKAKKALFPGISPVAGA